MILRVQLPCGAYNKHLKISEARILLWVKLYDWGYQQKLMSNMSSCKCNSCILTIPRDTVVQTIVCIATSVAMHSAASKAPNRRYKYFLPISTSLAPIATNTNISFPSRSHLRQSRGRQLICVTSTPRPRSQHNESKKQ